MNGHFYTREDCRLCSSRNLEKVLPLAPSPLCDAYVTEERLTEVQEYYPLDLYLCRDCGYVFLPHVVNPEIIYRDYIYVTTSSLGLSEHFRCYADKVTEKLAPPPKALVVDLGSNDGTLLGHFRNKGLRVLGVEPAGEIAHVATVNGIETVAEFFDATLADVIVKDHGPASIVTINNLLANIDDLAGMATAMRRLLADDGVLVIESSYLADMIENMVFDFAYHEHLSYFSVKPLAHFLPNFGLELFDVERVSTKGGSLRYYVQPLAGPRPVSPEVGRIVTLETMAGLDGPEIFRAFARAINQRKEKLVTTLQSLRAAGHTIAGYGGSATTTTLLHHFGIGSYLDFIVDDNPSKQHTFSPGLHIPVLPTEALYERNPDYVILLAWRYADPIIAKHGAFADQGGHFIRPLPEVEIL